MSVENEVYGVYDFMGQQLRPCRGRDRVERFVEAYHHIRDSDVHVDLQKNGMEEWWRWNDEQ
jgi:hypothetical protein